VKFVKGQQPDLEPSPNYDCHVLKVAGAETSSASPRCLYENSQVCFNNTVAAEDTCTILWPFWLHLECCLDFSFILMSVYSPGQAKTLHIFSNTFLQHVSWNTLTMISMLLVAVERCCN